MGGVIMEEYKIGEVFQFGKKKLKCVEASHNCAGCFLSSFLSSFVYCTWCTGECSWNKRTDRKDVIFVEVKEEDNENG